MAFGIPTQCIRTHQQKMDSAISRTAGSASIAWMSMSLPPLQTSLQTVAALVPKSGMGLGEEAAFPCTSDLEPALRWALEVASTMKPWLAGKDGKSTTGRCSAGGWIASTGGPKIGEATAGVLGAVGGLHCADGAGAGISSRAGGALADESTMRAAVKDAGVAAASCRP